MPYDNKDFYWKALNEFRIGVGDKPVVFVPNSFAAQLQSKLIREEASELMFALDHEDEAAICKEACDLLYVTFDTLWKFDLPARLAFNAVHANNMLKLNYPRNEYGKIIKPRDHPKVDLKKIIEFYREDGA